MCSHRIQTFCEENELHYTKLLLFNFKFIVHLEIMYKIHIFIVPGWNSFN